MPAETASKQARILIAAADLFSTRRFHEVRLDDIAAQAGVGKGTVYLYWTSKEEVYMAVVRKGFTAVYERLSLELPGCQDDCWKQINVVINAIVDFAFAFPGVFQLMRSGLLSPEDDELQRIRALLTQSIEDVVHTGVNSGQFVDPCPALTAQYILSFVRGAMLYPPKGFTPDLLKAHMRHILQRGLSLRGDS